MRVAVLATGGKDSTLALHHVLSEGFEVACLVSMIPEKADSWLFHYPNLHLMDLFAQAVELPLVKGSTSGMKEKEVADLKTLLKGLEGLKVEGVVSGAVASTYQKRRIERVCQQLNMANLTPLWHMSPSELLKRTLELQFETIITGVSAHGLTVEWLGKRIDSSLVTALTGLSQKYGLSLVGEGGEYETLVLDAAFFKKKIHVVEAETVWQDQRGFYFITKAELEEK